ncbi:MAG: hypothetical protein J6O72_02675 [Lachnospira sp.]|nr:hypothetical protein [Lachnospira sp.]
MVRILKKFNRKSTRRSRSKAAAIALTTVMALSAAVVFTVPKAEAANGPCDEGDWAYAYIAVGNSETKDNIFSSQGSNAIDGVSYDKASNTLTLNQYKNADNYIATNMMGDDFKIRLIGENEISSIVAYGDAWGGSVTICGDGSLTVNPKKQEDYGVRLYAEGTASVLSVENTCNVTIYAGQAGKVLYTTGNLTDKVIKDNGTLQETPQYQISHPLDIARIYAKYYAYDPSTTNVVYTNGDSSYYTLTYSLNENDEITAYNLYQLTKKEALGDIYYAVKIGSYDTMPEGYTQTVLDTDISYYDAAWGSGGTSNLVINTATNEKYAMVYDYDSETGSSVYRICALNDFLGMDEQGRDEVWLVDYDNPVSVIPAASMGQDEQLPDGFKYDGEEQENVFNIEVSADKLTFTAKTSSDDSENPSTPFVPDTGNDNTTTKDTVIDVSDGKSAIQADTMKNLIADNQKNDVVIKTNNDITFTFAKGTMTETAGAGAYDFSTAVTSDIKEAGTLPEEVTENIFVSKIVYNYSGQLPATASIRLNVGNTYAGETLYYSRLLEDGTIINMMSAVVDKDGYMTVEQNHCSTYLITKQQLNAGSTNAASNDTDNSKNTAADNTTAGADNTAAASTAVSETPKTADMTSMCAVLFIFMTAAVGMTVIVSMAFKIKKERRFMK